MYYVAAVAVGAGIGAIASNSASNKQKDAATYAADQQYAAQQQAMQQTSAAADQAYTASIAAAEMMAGATTEAARIQAEAAKHAADQQLRAAREALALQTKQWEKMQADMTPYLQAGGTGLNQLSYGLGLGGYNNVSTDSSLQSGYLQKAFSEEDFAKNFTKTPGYEFRLSEGIKSLDRSASAQGNLLSGQQLKGITRFGQDFASNEYQNAYARAYGSYTQNQDTQYNHLANLTNMGQNTAVQMGNAGMNYASNYGQTLMGATTAANNYNVNAANSNANLLVNNAQYAGNQSQYANNMQYQAALANGQYGINGANALGNAAIAKANATASSYMGYGQIANNFANALGQYYGKYNWNNANIPDYNFNTNFTPSSYNTDYGNYNLSSSGAGSYLSNYSAPSWW